MRNFIIIMLLTASVLTISSCKKDKTPPAPIFNATALTEKIQGPWDVRYAKHATIKDGKLVETEGAIASGTFIYEFKGNNLVVYEKGDTPDARTFNILSENEVEFREGSYGSIQNFKFNSNTQLILSQSTTRTENGNTYKTGYEYTLNKLYAN